MRELEMNNGTSSDVIYICCKCGLTILAPYWIKGNPICGQCFASEAIKPPSLT